MTGAQWEKPGQNFVSSPFETVIRSYSVRTMILNSESKREKGIIAREYEIRRWKQTDGVRITNNFGIAPLSGE